MRFFTAPMAPSIEDNFKKNFFTRSAGKEVMKVKKYEVIT